MDLATRDSISTSLDCKGNSIISGHEDGYIREWDLREPTPKHTYKSHTSFCSQVQFSPVANIFLSVNVHLSLGFI